MHYSVSQVDTIPPNYEAVKLISLSFIATTFEMAKIVALLTRFKVQTNMSYFTPVLPIYVCPVKLDLKGGGQDH